MPDNQIVCPIDMFSATQSVMYPDGHTERIPTDQLVTFFTNTCFSENMKVHFFGNEEYIADIVCDIVTEYNTKYSTKLEIEVN